MFRSDENRIIFEGDTGRDFLNIAAALHNLVHKLGYSDIILDFSRAIKLAPSFMLPLSTIARSYRKERVDFEIILPTDQRVSNFMVNSNWAFIISPERFEARDHRNLKHLSAVQYTNGQEQHSAVDRSVDIILRNVEGLDRSRIKALEWSLNEITDNVLNHSSSQIGGFVQVITNTNKQTIDFYVCDAGVGIPTTLLQGRPDLGNDVRAMRAAIEEGVTRNKNTNQGNGLFGTFKCCEVSGGTFTLVSNFVTLNYNYKDGLRVSKSPIPFKGSFVRASINYAYDMILEKALVFKGKTYSPGFDYIERTYQSETDEIVFVMKNEVESFGSREVGRAARIKVENLLDLGRNKILFDFEGLHLISSSFADEVFGRIYNDYGPIAFSQMCRFKNIEPTVRSLIDLAISKRIKAN